MLTSRTFTVTENAAYSTPDTYFPISAYEADADLPYSVQPANTGYVIGGANFHNTDYPYRSGDIRVSEYTISNISGSYTPANGFSSVYTIDGGGAHVIGASNSFVKYTEARAGLLKVFQANPNYVYGLHFMEAAINKNDAAILPHAVINGDEYFDRSMPRNSIDFMLKEAGYINFFAGNYFNGNDSFFSLHQIFRDESGNITDIKKISRIYRLNSGSTDTQTMYAYLYSDGTTSDGQTHRDTDMVFNTAWIERQTNVSSNRNRLFYFEVPANAGEYALGSVDGGTGAYLLYLDISANAQEILRQEITEVTTITTNHYEYPLGVQAVASASPIVDTNSVAVAIGAGGNAQTATVSRTGDTVTFTGTGTANYRDESLRLVDSGGNDMVVVPKSTSWVKEMRITVMEYNTTSKVRKTVLTVITEDSDGNRTERQFVDGIEVAEFTDDTAMASGTNALVYHYQLPANADVTHSFIFGPKDSTTGLLTAVAISEYPAMGDPAVTVTDKVSMYDVTVTSTADLLLRLDLLKNGYTATINGYVFRPGNVVPVNP